MFSAQAGGRDDLPARKRRRPALRQARWLVPVVVVAAVAIAASGVFSGGASGSVPVQSAPQLLASISNAKVSGFSGTVVEKASLGLPDLGALGGSTGSTSTGPLSLLSGSHTARVWYGGPTQQRIALIDTLSEQDIFHNGRDVWQWDSGTRTASHTVLPAATASAAASAAQTLSPPEAARRALDLVGPSTAMATDKTTTMLGRSAYTLTLTPKQSGSLVSSVRIVVDSATRIPLSVQVIAVGSTHPAIDVSFTYFSPTTPDAANFVFTPPPGTTTTTAPAGPLTTGQVPGHVPSGVSLSGSAWTTVAKISNGASMLSGTATGKNLGLALTLLPKVSGSWGSGQLFTSSLVSALITDKGAVYVGAVQPSLLYQAAAG